MGFKADFGDFTQSLKITDTKTSKVDRTYEMRQVKQSKMHYVAEQLTVDFENAKAVAADIAGAAYADEAAGAETDNSVAAEKQTETDA